MNYDANSSLGIPENDRISQVLIKGGKPLHGTTTVDGSKNSILAIIPAACLVSEGVTRIDNVPNISDVAVMEEILTEIGFHPTRTGSALEIDNWPAGAPFVNPSISKYLANKIRASILFLGVFTAKFGEAEVPLPGGDKIGDRPVDMHLESLETLGIQCTVKGGTIYAKAKDLPLQGAEIFLRFPSVGVTENLMLAAVLAKGETMIENAAKEPEIVDLAMMLNRAGAKITGAGSSTITIMGVEKLHGCVHEVIPDRLEAGTLLVSIAITGGTGIIRNVIADHCRALLWILKKTGVEYQIHMDGALEILKSGLNHPFNAIAMPYPGLPTDLQPIISSLATQCEGESLLQDLLYSERFAHINELRKMGAEIHSSGNSCRIIGRSELNGAVVKGVDIRSVTSLICAGLAANDMTYVQGVEHLHRGHGELVKKLTDLGADIQYVSGNA
jgi:UDP-N-acetylglucosamine 1-carboxyvinyltransferase